LILGGLLACAAAASAQSNAIEKHFRDRLLGKVVSLKTFRKASRLEFGQDDQLKNKGAIGSWTIYSQVFVTDVRLSVSRMRILGDRVVHHSQRGQPKLVASRSDLNAEIEIELKPGATIPDIEFALLNVFAGSEGIATYVPEYWKEYFGGKPIEKCQSRPILSGTVKASRITEQPKPQYSEEARKFLLEGVVELEAEILENGRIGAITIMKPAGAGFDEPAIEAVSKWKYTPTTVDGTPACVISKMTVNYEFN